MKSAARRALGLEGVSAHYLQPALREPIADGRISADLGQPLRDPLRITGSYQERRVPDGLPDPSHVGRDHGQPRSEGLVEDLGEPLGPGDVGERVRLSVCLGQACIVRDIAAHLDGVRDPQLLDPLLQGPPQLALPTDDESPARIEAAEGGDHVGERHRILLGFETADAQCDQVPGVVTADLVRDVARTDQ